MSIAAPAGHASPLIHAVGFYRSDDEFLRAFVPFCDAGLEAGEPTLVRLAPEKADLLRSGLADADGVVFLPHGDEYLHAPGALASALDLYQTHSTGNGRPVRLLGELPVLSGLSADAWLRYEAAVNHVLKNVAIHALCACDTRTTPEPVRAELLRNHHTVLRAGAEEPNDRYEPPVSFMGNRRQVAADPLEAGTPSFELRDPSPAATRHAVTTLAGDMDLDTSALDDLLLGATEVLTNALLHGRQPVTVRAWGEPGRVLVAVHDAGSGPDEPFAGLLPLERSERDGGLGLWITHQLCPEAAMATTADGFTVRLAAGQPA